MAKFWEQLRCVLPDEHADYVSVCQRLSNRRPMMIFQPLDWYCLEPLWLLHQTSLRQYVPTGLEDQVFIMPVDPESTHFTDELKELLTAFYLRDEVPEWPGRSYAIPEMHFNESILLRHPRIRQYVPSEDCDDVNAVYISIDVDGLPRPVHFFLLYEKPERVWALLAESPENHIHLFADIRKGRGGPLLNSKVFAAVADGWPGGFLPDCICSQRDLVSYADADRKNGRHSYPPMAYNLRGTDSIFYNREEYFAFFMPVAGAPWAAHVETLLSEQSDNRHRRAEIQAALNAFLAGDGDCPTEDALQLLEELISRDLVRHEYPPDLPPNADLPSFIDYYDKPTPGLLLIAELFICRAAMFVYADTYAEIQELHNRQEVIARYFSTRRLLQRIYPNAYRFCLADEELDAFAQLLLPALPRLREYMRFCNFLSDEAYNDLETALLSAAYRQGDRELARWIFDNNFAGRVHTSLFTCLFHHDREHAAQIAPFLTPGCIAWILDETCDVRKTADGMEPRISNAAHFIFERISRQKAEDVLNYIPRRDRPERLPVLEELLRLHFPDES